MQRAVERIAGSPRRAFACIFGLAFAVRAVPLAVGMIPPAWVLPESLGGNEVGVARTLALTGRFADPYLVPTGPTAHPLPLYTGLQAGLFELFGVTLAAGYARCLLHIASRAAMLGLLPWVAARLGVGVPAGVLGGLAGAVVLQDGVDEILGWSGNEPYAAIALGLLLVAHLRRWTGVSASVAGSLLLGAGWGVAFHLVPALTVVLLGCLAFELWWRRGGRRWTLALAVVAGAAAACLPWAWRNWNAFHAVLFIRSNLGLELRVANHAVFAYMFRYTVPVNWMLLMLAGAAVWGWIAPAGDGGAPAAG